MKRYFEVLKAYIEQHPPNCGDAESVLGMLYECHNENNPYDNEQIKTDFNELYQQMNGMVLREMDKIIYPVCKLCRDHERAGFVHGIQIGFALFFIVIPKPALPANQALDIIRTLERMNCRESVLGENHKAESIAMVVWDPDTGEIDSTYPGKDSNLRLEKFAKRIEDVYLSRYKGLPPHER